MHEAHMSPESEDQRASEPEAIGMLAGWGQFPIVVTRALKKQGFRVVILGLKDHTPPELRELCDVYYEVGLGRMGAAIRYFKRHDVRRATMAGKIHKVILFRRFAWLKHFPDWTCLKTFYPHWIAKTKDRKDDTLLSTIADGFFKHGIVFAPATDFAPELLVNFGILAGRRLSKGQQKDIQFGWQLAKEMGRLDVGQTVAVKGQAVLAVEAVEGTDACIARAGQLCPQGGFTIVKVAKPNQDMRFDVPTIGVDTIKNVAKAGGRVLAIQADRTIVLDRDELASCARKLGVSVVAIHTAEDTDTPEIADREKPPMRHAG